MRRDWTIVALLAVLFSAAGYALIATFTPFPVAASWEARVVDDAFTLLTLLAVPVFAFVFAMLVYSGLRFRSSGPPDGDGPAIRSHVPLVAVWLLVTGALTVAVIIHPGITGITELRAEEKKAPDLVVQVEAFRWGWKVTYSDYKVSSRRELVLPVNRRVRFYVTSTDILHAFWVPAFRMKIDAVPGMTTTVVTTPTRLGSFDEDANYRLQCAELCGLGHALMRIPVRVVDQQEFEAWISQQRPVR